MVAEILQPLGFIFLVLIIVGIIYGGLQLIIKIFDAAQDIKYIQTRIMKNYEEMLEMNIEFESMKEEFLILEKEIKEKEIGQTKRK